MRFLERKMAKATMTLRHVWRELNDGNTTQKVLTLQQFYEAEGWEYEDWRKFDDSVNMYGHWEDVQVCNIG
jgi:hypothetical protein